MTVDFPVTSHDTMLAVDFVPPPVPPSPFGLYPVTSWQNEAGPTRYLNGVEIRSGGNYGGEGAFGVWEAPWCSVPPLNYAHPKTGERPDILDVFGPMVVWAYDQCDPTPESRRQVQQNASQILALEEQTAVEREFADRLKMDADDLLGGVIPSTSSFRQAVGMLEAAAALTNTLCYFHASPRWASADIGLVNRSGTKLVTPMGHTWVFGGGYVDGLDDEIVVTSQPFGWRDSVTVRTALDPSGNLFVAVAERTVVVGYEAVIAAVQSN